MESDLADIKNVGGRLGGACNAAIFLSEFINNSPDSDIKWLHCDIASTALPNARDSPYVPNGMTGVPVRALVQFVRNSL